MTLPIAGALLYSAFPHIDNPYHFLNSIDAYKLFGNRLATATAFYLPIFMLVLGMCLLFLDELRRPAFLFSGMLFLSFVAVQSVTLYRGLNISCGCFGSSNSNPIGTKSIAIASVGLILSLTGYLVSHRLNNAKVPTAQ